MSYVYLKGVCFMNFLKKSLSTILCCALTVNTLGLSSIIANATESDSKGYVYDGYKINKESNIYLNTEDKKYYIWENGAFVEYTEGDVA